MLITHIIGKESVTMPVVLLHCIHRAHYQQYHNFQVKHSSHTVQNLEGLGHQFTCYLLQASLYACHHKHGCNRFLLFRIFLSIYFPVFFSSCCLVYCTSIKCVKFEMFANTVCQCSLYWRFS